MDFPQQQRRLVVVEEVEGRERLLKQRSLLRCFRVSYGYRCLAAVLREVLAVEQLFRLGKSPLVKACCCYLELRTQELAATGLDQRREHLEQRALWRTY
jgi:hypothetical protein